MLCAYDCKGAFGWFVTHLVFVADGAQGNTPDFELRFGTAMVSGFYPNFFFCLLGYNWHVMDIRFFVSLFHWDIMGYKL